MTILPIGKTYPAAEGASILQAMLAAGIPCRVNAAARQSAAAATFS